MFFIFECDTRFHKGHAIVDVIFLIFTWNVNLHVALTRERILCYIAESYDQDTTVQNHHL